MYYINIPGSFGRTYAHGLTQALPFLPPVQRKAKQNILAYMSIGTHLKMKIA